MAANEVHFSQKQMGGQDEKNAGNSTGGSINNLDKFLTFALH